MRIADRRWLLDGGRRTEGIHGDGGRRVGGRRRRRRSTGGRTAQGGNHHPDEDRTHLPHDATLQSERPPIGSATRELRLSLVDEGFVGIGTILGFMGFNPNRKFVAKPLDYVFVAAATLAVIGLLVWALLG